MNYFREHKYIRVNIHEYNDFMYTIQTMSVLFGYRKLIELHIYVSSAKKVGRCKTIPEAVD